MKGKAAKSGDAAGELSRDAERVPDAFLRRGFGEGDLAKLRETCISIAGQNFLGFRFVSDDQVTEYAPGVNPGPPGSETYSNRFTVAVRFRRDDARVGAALIQRLQEALRVPEWMTLNVGTDEGGFVADVGVVGQTFIGIQDSLPGIQDSLPGIMVKALLQFTDKTKEGTLVAAVALPWFEILDVLRRDPRAAHEIDARKWEEIIAGAYSRAGFDEVILTPRSADKGRDVVATKLGVGSIRIFDQVKAYKPGHVVTADEVRAMLGVITGAGNVSKGVITTTSTFAPWIQQDAYLAPFIPYRLELKPGEILLRWLNELADGHHGHRPT